MFLCNKIYFLFISTVRQHASRCSLKPSCRQPQTQGQSCHHAPVKYPSNLSTDLSSLSRSTSSQRLSPASLSGHQATAVTELPDSCPRVISSKCLIRRRCSTHRESKKWTAPMKYAPQGDYRLQHQFRHPRFEWCDCRIRRRCRPHRESKKQTTPTGCAPRGDFRLEHQYRHPRFEWCSRRIRR